MNTEQEQLFARIKNFSLDKPNTDFTFSQRLATENDWNLEYTNRVIEEYQKFIFLAMVAGHIVTPSEQIDQVWHLHLTYTHSYWDEFCPQILGQPLHHQPTEGGDREEQKYHGLYQKTLDSYAKFFGSQPPEDIWSPTEVRFGKDLSVKRVNTEDNWVIPKPNLSLALTNIINNIPGLQFNRVTTIIVSLLLILLISFGTAFPGLARNFPFYWDYINVTLNLQNNGDLLVTEEQKYVFNDSELHQHYRFIKLDKIKKITDVQVFEDNHPLPIKTYKKGDEFWIRWQDYLDNQDSHTFILKYKAIGTIRARNGENELYWKAIFPKRDAPINHSEITINLPQYLADNINHYYHVGGAFKGSLVDPTTINFNSLQALSPGKSTLIIVDFPSDILDLKAVDNLYLPKDSTDHFFSSNLFQILIAVIFVGIFWVFRTIFPSNNKKSKNNKGGCSGSCSSGCSGGCGGCGGGCGGGG